MDLSQRIDAMLTHYKLTSKGFALTIGVNQQRLYDLKSGKTRSVSSDLTNKISSCFPDLSLQWLLTGEGEMLRAELSENKMEGFPDSATEEKSLIPLLPTSAQGGSLNDFVVSVKSSDCEKVLSPIRGADFALPVAGDSMAPEYPNGSQVHIKKINEKAFIEWGKVYVLDTCNGVVIKRIVPSDKEGYVKCLSINPDPIFAPFEVSLEDVYGIYRVLLCLAIK